MAGKQSKIYAVFQGFQPGLYDSWAAAAPQVQGFKGARYKGFRQVAEAIAWLRACTLTASESVDEAIINLIKNSYMADSQVNSDITRSNGEIVIHTDGSAAPNPGSGGYGIVLQQGQLRKELSAGYQLTTNNRMEMLAVIVALQALKSPAKVTLYTDSKYVVDSITKGWVKRWQARDWKKSDGKQAENIDLWQQLLPLLDQHEVSLQWIKGHAGHPENERCDVLANEARKSGMLREDAGYLSR